MSRIFKWVSGWFTPCGLSGSTGIAVCPLNTPVEDVVVLIPFADEEIPEELPQVRVIRLVVKP